jgi:hypothetical protein
MGRLVNLSVSTGPGLIMVNMRLSGKLQEYVSSLAKLFNETIASGFITLPKFAFSHLSTLKMMNPEDNFLNIDNKFMRIMTAYFCAFTIPF